MGYGIRTNQKSGWKRDIEGREKAYNAKNWKELPELLLQAAERLRGVQIENRPAAELLKEFNRPGVLAYLDPPYLLETRNGGKQYKCEMSRGDHIALLEVARAHKGKILISGYPSGLYSDMLQGWHRKDTYSLTQSGRKRKECLWMNFTPCGQMSIRDFGGVARSEAGEIGLLSAT